jgi:hypothetical protein
VLFREALEHARGLAALHAGDADQALTLLGESLRLVRSTGDYEAMAGILEGVAVAAAARSARRLGDDIFCCRRDSRPCAVPGESGPRGARDRRRARLMVRQVDRRMGDKGDAVLRALRPGPRCGDGVARDRAGSASRNGKRERAHRGAEDRAQISLTSKLSGFTKVLD